MCAEQSLEGSKRCEHYSRMGCHRHSKGRLACAERSTERSKRSERYSFKSCRRRFRGRRDCAERNIERSEQDESRRPAAACAATPDASGSVHALVACWSRSSPLGKYQQRTSVAAPLSVKLVNEASEAAEAAIVSMGGRPLGIEPVSERDDAVASRGAEPSSEAGSAAPPLSVKLQGEAGEAARDAADLACMDPQ